MTTPNQSPATSDKRICHAPGDRCQACPHYYGKSEVCTFAPSATPSPSLPDEGARKKFMTPEQCAQQFELYAKNHPSKDSAHSLRFCADFLREFCIQSK